MGRRKAACGKSGGRATFSFKWWPETPPSTFRCARCGQEFTATEPPTATWGVDVGSGYWFYTIPKHHTGKLVWV